MTLRGVLALIAGAACIGAAALAWTGRWRRWSRRTATGPLPLPITLLPGIGFALAGAGLWYLDVAKPLATLGLLALLAAIGLYLSAPQWWGPRWFREERERGVDPDLSDTLTALTYASGGRPAPGESSAEVLAGLVGDREPLERWGGIWIDAEGPDAGPAPHRLTRAGTTQVRLELFDDALAMKAVGLEDRLRGHATVGVIDRASFRAARVVPAGAGPDGVKRPGAGPRSLRARLVVDTDDESFLFEVTGAKRKAQRIEETLGR